MSQRPTSQSGPLADALVRWLTALSLVQTAESLILREADVSAAVALIGADAAIESTLALIAAGSNKAPKRDNFDDLIDRARDADQAAEFVDPPTISAARAAHTQRNAVVHHGATATRSDALRATRTARALLEALPKVSNGFGAVPPGSGVASGVAALIRRPDIGDQLRLGDEAIIEDRPDDAADAAGRAFYRSFYFTTPPLEPETVRRETGRFHAPYDDYDRRILRDDIEGIRQRVNQAMPWLLAPSLGLQPTEYVRLTGLFGYYIQYATYPHGSDTFLRETPPSAGDARWAVERVAQVIFRLWETGALVEGEDVLFDCAPRPPRVPPGVSDPDAAPA